MSRKQAIVGVLSRAIEALPADKRPPREIVLKWLVATENIKQRNSHLNSVAAQVDALFQTNGHRCSILKGQGIAQLYPQPELRTSGDIDVWVDGKRADIVSFVRERCKSSHEVYHHIDGLRVNGVEIETHFTPSYMSNPFANRRLQSWIRKESSLQFEHSVDIAGGRIHVPTLAFNRVFILHHIYRHFFYEGIGLRQMMDLYYVLKQGFSKAEKAETVGIYRRLNLLGFAGACIYVLHTLFGLEEKFHIVAPNKKFGEVLLSEILVGGNFGQAITYNLGPESKFERGWRIMLRSMRFLQYAPLEVVWMPYFKVINNILYVRDHTQK
ncbi:MAG: nucleotidyltransferase family protein [Alistipes sp.]|nr:nucleotidyltransferase family protein [Alistipes sp.]